MSRRTLLLLALLALAGCATALKPRPTGDGLKRRSEAFHRSLRWGDLRGAAAYVHPDQRRAWLQKALDGKDEDNLKVLEYAAEDAQVDLPSGKAQVLSRMTWHRLPSLTMNNDTLVVSWEAQETTWYVTSIERGPLPLAAPDPLLKQLP